MTLHEVTLSLFAPDLPCSAFLSRYSDLFLPCCHAFGFVFLFANLLTISLNLIQESTLRFGTIWLCFLIKPQPYICICFQLSLILLYPLYCIYYICSLFYFYGNNSVFISQNVVKSISLLIILWMVVCVNNKI